MIVILCGPPCTGKSTIGSELQHRLGFTHLEMDSVRQRVLPNSDQRLEHRDIGYRAMHLLAEHLLRTGQTVIVNATYNRELHRTELGTILKSLECPAVLVQCTAPLDLVISRFKSRPPGHAALDLDEDLVRELWSKFAYSSDGVVINTSRDPEETFAAIQTHIVRGENHSLERWMKMQ
jgi:uncharacterized protein